MRIVEYDYKPEFATSMGIDHTHQTGTQATVKQRVPVRYGGLECDHMTKALQ